jgi:hypothetical protein
MSAVRLLAVSVATRQTALTKPLAVRGEIEQQIKVNLGNKVLKG